MTIELPAVHKTNLIFNRITAALGLSQEQKIEWLNRSGHAVSKSKIVNWGSRGKNYVNMPDNILTDFLELVSVQAKSPTLRVLAKMLAVTGDYERISTDELDAVSEMVALLNREYGYTPNNLRHECGRVGGREKFAELHSIAITTVHNWCTPVDDEANHRDMPAKKWAEVVKT